MKILTASFQIVAALRIVGEREVIVNGVDVLVAVARQIVVTWERKTAEGYTGPAVGDAVCRLPVFRPRRQTTLIDAVRGVADPELVQRPAADDLRQLCDHVGGVLAIAVGRRRMVRRAGAERLEPRRTRHLTQ